MQHRFGGSDVADGALVPIAALGAGDTRLISRQAAEASLGICAFLPPLADERRQEPQTGS